MDLVGDIIRHCHKVLQLKILNPICVTKNDLEYRVFFAGFAGSGLFHYMNSTPCGCFASYLAKRLARF